jgi:hypothetical protein
MRGGGNGLGDLRVGYGRGRAPVTAKTLAAV